MCLACNFRIASNYHSRKHSALQSSPCTLLTLKVSTIKLLNLHAYWVSNKARQGSQNLYEYSPLSISDKARKAIGSTESIYPPMKLTAWYQVCTHPASSLFIFFWSYGGGPKDRYKDTSPGMQFLVHQDQRNWKKNASLRSCKSLQRQDRWLSILWLKSMRSERRLA